ncbi:MAG TPA: DUF3857 domain-containing protein [Panacibacter sp.]|nr:DUF3857 domain-containing protein [Panacibacter sp.]
MRNIRTLVYVSTLFFFISATAQSPLKYGVVKPEDFAPTVYSIDSNADAVVLTDIGSSEFDDGVKSSFSLVYKEQKRMRIMNKNGFDAATVQILLHVSNNNGETLDNLEAVTYNLENGQVVATKLDKASIFKDKYNENYIMRKFTFPNIKEGSIIEYRYTITSPYFTNLRSWDFQAALPRLWSEYTVTIPSDIFDFVMIGQGYHRYEIDTSTSSSAVYHMNSRGGFYMKRSQTVTGRWAMKDVPALKPESFITTLDNYQAKLEFQLKRIMYDTYNDEYMSDWYKLTEELMKRDDFGTAINAGNGWMGDDLKKITTGATDDYSKAKKIFEYFRDNFTCTRHEGFLATTTLKKAFDGKSGSVGDINLLLIAALKHMNFEAEPAILSTRDNGIANELYPLINKFNYVICHVKIGDQFYMLDASDNKIGFGKLPKETYNGSARVIGEIPILITLSPDSLKETKLTSLFAVNEDDKISATLSTQYGDFESREMREKLSKMQPDDYLKEVKQSYSFDPELSNIEIDSLKIPEQPLGVKYDLKFSFSDDIVYFNPVFADVVKENPFKSAERFYPVEMPACTDDTYLLNMEIPAGYKVEELPKSTRVMLNEDEGMFEYIIQANADHIQLRCRTQIKKATFEPEDYETLRNFFAFIVQKEGEQIVFKKIK